MVIASEAETVEPGIHLEYDNITPNLNLGEMKSENWGFNLSL